jgi:thymidine phosphorylase
VRGLGEAGRVALTRAMRDTGRVLAWDLGAPAVDKHSTGGVGDSISLLLAPALAECGVYVPMVSGRGLGHTGGTLDKLEAIPGYRVDQSEGEFRQIVKDVGCAIVAATGEIAPADRRLYAIRDVTATVESIDLITASILSKKLAAGLDALVLDVKVGSGAFLPSAQQAQALARSLVDTANGAGCRTAALITDMDQPLACTAGNALEVAEVMGALTCDPVHQRLWDLTVALGGEVLALCGAAPDAQDGGQRIRDTLQSGRAAERFARMVAAQGGPRDFLTRWRDQLPGAPVVRDVPALAAGVVSRIDTRAVGEAVVHLGGGRLRNGDAVDPRVGFSDLRGLGMGVGPGVPLARVHAATEDSANRAIAAVQAAYTLGETPDVSPLVQGRVA